MSVDRPHHPDPRHHLRAVALSDEQQRLHRRLPLCRVVLGLRQLGDVLGGIAQREQLATIRQEDRIEESCRSAHRLIVAEDRQRAPPVLSKAETLGPPRERISGLPKGPADRDTTSRSARKRTGPGTVGGSRGNAEMQGIIAELLFPTPDGHSRG